MTFPPVVRWLAGATLSYLDVHGALADVPAATVALNSAFMGGWWQEGRWSYGRGKVTYQLREHGEGVVPVREIVHCAAAAGHELGVRDELAGLLRQRSAAHERAHPLARSSRGRPLPAESAAEHELHTVERELRELMARVRAHLLDEQPAPAVGDQLDLFAGV